MHKNSRRLSVMGILIVVLMGLVLTALACGGQAPAPTPVPTVAPAPTAVPAATAAPAPVATPTPTAAVTQPQPRYGGVLRFPLTVSIDAPDPAWTILHGSRRTVYFIYNTLVKQMPDGSVKPEVARSWEVASDGKSITFQLERGIKFHDGTDLNAQAVKWNYDRFLDPAVGSARRTELSPPLQSVDVIDDYTVKFNISAPSRPLMSVLTLQAGLIASPTAVQKYNSYADRNGEFGRKPVGSGPFKMQEWVPGSHFNFVKNEGYWEKGLPYLDGIWTPVIADTQVQFAMLRTGEVDFIDDVRPQDLGIVSRNPNLRVVEQSPGTWIIFFRTNVSPWDNKALRQAFGYAINRQAIIDTVFAGQGKPAQSVIGPAMGAWYDPTIQVYDYSPQKAKQKLAEAGYPSGFSFTMPCRTGTPDALMCETIQAMLAESGISMNIRPYEIVTYFSDFVAGKHDGPMSSWWGLRPDPGFLIRLLYHTKGSQNTWKYSNLEVDRLIEEADSIYDLAKAKAVYNKALTMIAEDAPNVFVAWMPGYYGMRENVRGFAPTPDRVPRLRELWLDR